MPRVLSHRAKPEKQNAFIGMVSYSEDCGGGGAISCLFIMLCLRVSIAPTETHDPEQLGKERGYFSS